MQGQRAPFPYLEPPPTPAEIVEHIRHKDIGVESYLLKGGVRLNVKTTDFQAKQVLLSVQFGKGKQGEPAEGWHRFPRP